MELTEKAKFGGHMKKYETPNYIFHYNESSKAEQDIAKIAACQELCFAHICNVLKIFPPFKIKYILCDSPDEVGRIYGDDEPCSGFASPPNTIYAVYNEELQCIGFHEDSHIISYLISTPDCSAIREGFAMYFDKKWWGIQNLDWAGYFLEENRFIAIDKLLDNEVFSLVDCSISYPIMGAFTEWLISAYGTEKYIEFYKGKDTLQSLEIVYNMTPKELNQVFTEYVSLFRIDEALRKRMGNLLRA